MLLAKDYFIARVFVDASGCWLWQHAQRNGYGLLTSQGVTEGAHRAAFKALVGPIPEGFDVCHTCDVPLCVNPEHLWVGTRAQNSQDMARKGRQVFQKSPEKAPKGARNGSLTCPEARPRGVSQWQAKLDDDLVAAMRATVLCGAFTALRWARWLSISHSTAKRAVSGKTWAHVVLCLALLASTGMAEEPHSSSTRESRRLGGRVVRGVAGAFFEFAPSNGTGMGAPCACTTPTGAKGEAMTFTRASNGTCTKTATGGLATTGIADGDLVVCSTNQPRVEYDSSGTLGLLVEGARTNTTLRSQELDNVAWGAVGPTVTANYGVAPDGTTTAERAQIPATTVTNSYLVSAAGCSGVASVLSVYVKGVSGSGTMDLCQGDVPVVCTSCSFVAGSWSRCTHVAPATPSNYYVGNLSGINGLIARAANDVLLWGAQCEAGAFLSSYIPTTSAAVTRALDNASFSIAWSSTTYSKTATINTERTVAGSERAVTLKWGATMFDDSYFPSAYQTFFYDGAAKTTNAALGMGALIRVGSYYDLTDLGAVREGVVTTSARTIAITGTPVIAHLGSDTAGTTGSLNGIISKVCIDPSPTRCR